MSEYELIQISKSGSYRFDQCVFHTANSNLAFLYIILGHNDMLAKSFYQPKMNNSKFAFYNCTKTTWHAIR